jgi:tetratricopeptide (TPR) repeat protein
MPDLPHQRDVVRVDQSVGLLQRRLHELSVPMTMTIARLATLLVALTSFVGAARAAPDEGDEHRAITHFAAGEYKQALDIYARLYADTLHPTYLRNIARCYQNLGEADKAISSFREYLRKAKDLPADQRAEIEGYIAELERRKSAPSASPPSPPSAPPPSAPPPPAPPPAVTEPPPPAPLVGPPTVASTSARDDDSPVYTRWWFWAAAGGVVVAAVATAVLLSGDSAPAAGNLGALDLTDKSP